MKVDSETDGARLAAKDDDRITKIGKVLRATHLDELPQVFNILMGQMSVVGPRPERPEIAAQYEEEIPEFRFRLKVKAGLTGYAQVYGKYNTTPYDKLKLDLYYIQHYKVWTDIPVSYTHLNEISEQSLGILEGKIDPGTSVGLSATDRSIFQRWIVKKVKEMCIRDSLREDV